MTLFEWFRTCSIEELAEWLIAFQDQCEKNIFDTLQNYDIEFTTYQLDKNICMTRLIQTLNTELE